MALIDDPGVGVPLLTPRGYFNIPGTDEETHPTPPPKDAETTISPSFSDYAVDLGSLINPSLPSPTMDAAFRSSNTIGSAIAKMQDTYGVSNDLPDPNYSPWADVAGTKYEKYWKGTFSYSNNHAYTEALKRSIDRQEDDERTVAAGGPLGVIDGIIAGSVDPTLLLPVGGEVKLASKGVWSVARGALSGARAGALGTVAYETGLRMSQDIRTPEESAFNVGTGVILGAVVGSTIAGALTRSQRVASEEGLEHLVNMLVPGSVGAAAPHAMTLDDLTINGKITNNIAAGLAFSPNLRGNFREAPLARQTYMELATNTLRQNMHDQGLSLGPSVETNINVSLGETLGQALMKHNPLYSDAKKAGFGFSKDQFDEAIGRAMRRNDIGDNDFVTKGAQLWRNQVVTPLSDQAIKLGMLPEDVSVSEAPSYFMRSYNVDQMVAQKPQFMGIATDHFNEVLQQQYAKAADALQTRHQALDEELANLRLGPEDRIKKLTELEDKRQALENQFQSSADIADQVRNTREEARRAKESGDTAGEAAANAKIEQLKSAGGEDFQTFKKEEAKLKKTARQVNLGYGGLQSKADAISQQLTDLTHNNFRSLQRLVARGQKLARDLQRLDPAKAKQTVSDLRSDFYGLVTRSEQKQDALAGQIEKLRADEDKKVQSALAEAGLNKEKLNKKEQKQAERIEKEVRSSNTAITDRLNKALEQERARTAKLSSISDRLQAAEAIDRTADLHDVKLAVDEMTQEISNRSLGRGEKGAELLERLSKVDPSKVDEHIAQIEQLKKDLTRKFLDQWEIKRLGENINLDNPFLPETFYHGTTRKFEGLPGKSHGRGGIVVYSTDPAVASRYAGKQFVHEHGSFGDQRVFPVKIKKQDIADFRNPADVEKVRKYLTEQYNKQIEEGHDVPPFSMDSVKDGEWSIWEDPEMLKALGWKGAYVTEFAKGGGKELNIALLDPKHAVSKFDEEARAVPDFSNHAKDMAQDVYDSITGNDYGSASVDPKFNLSAKSGPLRDRTFHIPDEKIEPFLENNVVRVMSKFARRMAAQIEIARKFPDDPLLQNRFQAIKDQYDTLTNFAKTDKERTALQKDMKGAFRDLRALLEIHRGSYLAKENASSWGRIVRGTMLFNYIRSMGGASISSIADIWGPAVFHGLTRTMDVGVPALVQAVSKQGLLVKEAHFAGVAERLSHHRLLTFAEIGDPYGQGTAIERLLENGSHVASKWNGLNMLTDFQKDFDAIVVQHRLNTALLKGGDDKFLAYSGMDAVTRDKVRAELEQHATEEDGIKVANTDQWNDWEAVRAYRAAINLNVNADIVTRGIGDVPLAAYNPTFKMFLQFKTFNLAAHQRMFLRSMQLGPAQFLSGLIGMTTLGMFAATLKAMRGGEENWERFKESAKNPGYMVGEGIDNTGFFTLPLEISNLAEKAGAQGGYGYNPFKTPLMLAGRLFVPDASIQGNSQRYAQKSVIEALAGPTGGLIGDTSKTAAIPIDKVTGTPVSQGKQNAAQRIVPYQSYLGMRELLQILTGNSAYTDNK
jgi:hypothetical protein